MATVVYHQQQQGSCLESHIVEARTTLRLKLSPAAAPSTLQKCHLSAASPVSKGGWSFLQSLSDCSRPGGEESAAEAAYVHPLNKRSSSSSSSTVVLSDRSLQLCTENLGNETGTTDTAEGGILSSTWSAGSGEGRETGRRSLATRRTRVGPRSFPPPLTTMSGKDSIQVRSHREEGRLVIKAVKGQSRVVSCFRADRSEEGRLRLCLLENYSPNFDSRESQGNDEEIVKEEEEEEEIVEEEIVKKEEERGESEKVKDESEKVKKTEKGEMGIIERFGIGRGRCKESGEKHYIVENKSVLNWEPFWVAT